jgi:gluconolactonase
MPLVAHPLVTGLGFTEGPVIRPDGEIVVVSISHGKLYRIRNGKAEVLAETGGGPNGATEGLDGTIYVSQNGGKWSGSTSSDVTGSVQTVGKDGSVRYLTTDLVSPNDICFGPDGFLYVTDPTRFRPSRDDGRLWRVDPASGEAELLCSLPWYPNGLGFGLEDDALYVARTGEGLIMRFPLDHGRLGKHEVFAQMPFGGPDGFLFDVDGNLVTTAISFWEVPGQIQTFDRNGKWVDTFLPGPNKMYTNIALGADRVLIITDSHGGAVLTVENWPKAGLLLHPFRSTP